MACSPHPTCPGDTRCRYATNALAVGDFDQDGWLDLVVVNGLTDVPEPNVLLLNRDGTFEESKLPGGDCETYGVAVLDANGDGRLDIALANGDTANQLLLNAGGGVFTPSTLPGYAGAYRYPKIVAGDLNNDGYTDLVTTNTDSCCPNELLVNNGTGGFSVVVLPGGALVSQPLALGDVNGDGWIDIVIANYMGSPMDQLLINNRDGTFSSRTLVGTGTTNLYVADLNRDG